MKKTSSNRRATRANLRVMSPELEDALAAFLTAAAPIVDGDESAEPLVVDPTALRSIRRVGRIALDDATPLSRRARREIAASENVIQLAA